MENVQGGNVGVSTILAIAMLGLSSTGAPPGLDFPIPSVESYRYTSLKEVEAQDSLIRAVSGTSLSSTINDYHVLEVKLKLKALSSYSTPGSYLGQTVHSESIYLIVKSPGFVSSGISSPHAIPWPGGGYGVGGTISSGADVTFYVPFGESSTSPSGNAEVSWGIVLRRFNNMTGEIGALTYLMDSVITKSVCNDASIDSRKSYGQPNTEGIIPTDPNAPFRNINFGSYTYRGGLFVGNVQGDGKDKSRIGQIQLWPQSASGSGIKAAAVTLFATPQRSDMTGTFSIGSFVPSSGSANLSTTESNCNWAVKWDVTPTTGDGTEDLNLANLYPLDSVSVSSSTSGLISWNLTFPVDNNNDDPPNPALTNQVPPGVHQYVSLAMIGGTTSSERWQYFASREHLAELPNSSPYNVFPYSDARARIFLLTEEAP